MLRVNVGMSRKVSQDFNSTGFSINLDGEIAIAADDPEAIIEKIREFYDLAEEALQDQVNRHESDSSLASRDEEPRQPSGRNGSTRYNNQQRSSDNGHKQKDVVPATNKQIQFMLTVGQRNGLSKLQLEERIAEILGRKTGVYDLSKQEAGIILDDLTQSAGSNRSR